jgi:ligand-binding sensor domain-containing protein/DNA-binding response OmpR family regulator
MKQHNHFLRRLWAIALFLLMAGHIHAQLSQYTRFINVSLPYASNEIEQVWQDQQGMIWLVTRRGVFAFDGYNARHIVDGNYYAATALNKDVLVLGSDNGLRFLNIKEEKFCAPLGNVPQMGDIRSLALSNGVLYVGTKSKGLYSYDMKRKLWQRTIISNDKDDIIYSIQPVREGIFLGHIKGLSFMDHKGCITATDIHDNVYSVGTDARRGCLWVGTENGLLCRNLKTGLTTHILTGSTYNHFFVLPSGALLVASEYGLLLLHQDLKTWQIISHDASAPTTSLPSNRINAFFLDRQNNIWIATDRGAALARQMVNFEYTNLSDITQSHEGNTFTNVLVDAQGDRWMGGENGILHLSKNGVKWFRTGNGLKKNIIRCIYEDRDHDIWIATDASIARFNREKNQFDYFTLIDSKGRNSNWAYALYEDARGRLWVGTYMGGLYVVDKKALLNSHGIYKMTANPFARQDELVNIVYRLVPDDRGHLWAYTGKGLVEIDTHNMKATVRRKIFPDGMTVAGGSVWIDVQGHLYRYDIKSGAYSDTHFCVPDGMIYTFVKEQNRVWLSTTNGLYYIDPQDYSIHPYSKPEYKFTAGAYDAARNRIVWGGQDCMAFQNIKDESLNSNSKVYITDIRIEGNSKRDLVSRFTTDLFLDSRKNKRIFNRYYRGDSQHNGTGIGLAVVKKYVELHGGSVTAENNNGLTVSVSIPIREEVSLQPATDNKTQENENKPCVLVVDDNHEIVDFLTSALNDHYTVLAAYSGEDALRTITETAPDIIITDQMMPGMEGTELCKKLRENHSTTDTPIIMLTAKDDRETEMKSISCGADVFMPKPFNLQKLQLHIVQLLRRKNAIIKKIQISSIAERPYDEEEQENNDERLIADAMKAINNHMSEEDFNVGRLCELLNIDQKQLYRKLKKLTGKTPVSFIREQRLKRAAALLSQGQLTVSEVMYRVGFSSLSYFNKCFTEMYSVSPKDYRTV